LTAVEKYDILPLGNMKHEQLESAADVGRLIQAERKRQKLSQLQLAGLANTGIRFISDLENGKGTVQLQKLLAVISALGLSMFVYSAWSDK
jgi:y4mF family transcriptional regulator